MSLPPVLQDLARDLDGAPDLGSPALASALHRPIGIDDVAPWIRFDPANYVRSLVTGTDRWELRLLCWRPGQTTLASRSTLSVSIFPIRSDSRLSPFPR